MTASQGDGSTRAVFEWRESVECVLLGAQQKFSRPSALPVVGTDDTVRCLKFSLCQYDAEWKNKRILHPTTSKKCARKNKLTEYFENCLTLNVWKSGEPKQTILKTKKRLCNESPYFREQANSKQSFGSV
ncbi:hypothetical protein TNCT_616851 [Trichonephila clavata]|uniref:Uncharacterized protein n=1 Tax=Trichonephila clavata TaxID=2740835 RepID=A0A8X6HA40_TRICU|nr:hypothetical protein TNCT_616851 [Trichonephila clavata]